MVSGERAELCGLNVEGLRRCGFSVTEVGFWLGSVLDGSSKSFYLWKLYMPKQTISILISMNQSKVRGILQIKFHNFVLKLVIMNCHSVLAILL